MKVFKYELVETPILMPRGAEVLTIQVQAGVEQLWALVDESAPMEERMFYLAGTGRDIPVPAGKALRFIATVQQPSGVWHCFEFVPVCKDCGGTGMLPPGEVNMNPCQDEKVCPCHWQTPGAIREPLD